MIRTPMQLAGLLVVALALGAGTVAPARGATTQGNQGLQDGWAVNNAGQYSSPDLLAAQFPHMTEAGAGWVRISFRLGACFTDWTSRGCSTAESTDKTALGVYDQVVAKALEHNLKIVGLLSNESLKGNQSQWTNGAAETSNGRNNGDNRYLQAFATEVAARLAGRYQGTIDHWEIWNEPNAFTTPRGWTGKAVGGTYLYPSNFAWLLKRSYDAIKTATSGRATVISGGLFSYDGDSGESYLRLTITQGTKPNTWNLAEFPFHAVGQHIYVDQSGRTSDRTIRRVTDAIRGVYAELDPQGRSKQTWVTEIGWRTGNGGVDLPTQADNLQTAYTTLRNTSYLARVFWFKTKDLPNDGEPYGLLDAGGVKKPAFFAYQTYAR